MYCISPFATVLHIIGWYCTTYIVQSGTVWSFKESCLDNFNFYLTIRKNGLIMETPDKFEENAVIMLVSELAGSLDIAERFVASFPERVVTFDDYFSSTVQSRLREALEKVYTILQTITPNRYLNYVLKGGEFNNFVELFNRICEDKQILKETPSISQGVDFLCDVHAFKQFTARSKAIAIED